MGKGGLGKKGKEGGKAEGSVEKQVFSEERVKGYISQWHTNWGWVVPQQKIENPEAVFLNKTPNPRIYFHINDARTGSTKAEGDEISFFLYKDERGIGATDVTLRSEDDAEGGAEEATEEAGEEGQEEWAEEGEQATEEAGSWPGTALARSTPKMAAAPPKAKASIMPKAKAAIQTPKAKAAAAVQLPKAAAATATEFPKLFTSTRIGSKRRFKGKVNKWSGVYGWITPTDTLPEDLKSALMRFNAGIYTNWRHLQQGITMEAGLAVDFTVEADENGLVALDVGTTGKAGVNNDPFAEVQKALGGSIGSLKAELERTAMLEKKKAEAAAPPEPVEEEQQESYEQEAEPQEEQGHGEEESWGQEAPQETGGEEEAPLPPGWEAIWSDEHESYYFWHKATKTPAWERPTAPIATPTPPKAGPKAGGKAGAKGGKAGKSKAAVQQQVQEESYEEEAATYEEEPPVSQKRKGAPGKGDKNQAWKGGGKKQKSW